MPAGKQKLQLGVSTRTGTFMAVPASIFSGLLPSDPFLFGGVHAVYSFFPL